MIDDGRCVSLFISLGRKETSREEASTVDAFFLKPKVRIIMTIHYLYYFFGLCFSAMLFSPCAAYPSFFGCNGVSWSPGGNFGNMGIPTFTAGGEACTIDGVPEEFTPGAEYAVRVLSSSDLSHKIVATAGVFSGGGSQQSVSVGSCRNFGSVSQLSEMTWTAPTAEATAAFYALCGRSATKVMHVASPVSAAAGATQAPVQVDDVPTNSPTTAPPTVAPTLPGTSARVIHGSLMLLAFGLIMPGGAMFPMYFRKSKWWFKYHRAFQLLAIAISLGAFVVVATSKTKGTHFASRHEKLGIAIISAAFVQGLNGLLRPHVDANSPATNKRRIWSCFHHAMGIFTLGGGIANCILGADLVRLWEPSMKSPAEAVAYASAALTGVLILIRLILLAIRSKNKIKAPSWMVSSFNQVNTTKLELA